MMKNRRFLISYLTAVASAVAVAATFFTVWDKTNDMMSYTVIGVMMTLMFGYSVIIILMKPTSNKYRDILAQLHWTIHEIRILLTADRVSRGQLQESLTRILHAIRNLFSSITGSDCRASLLLIHEDGNLVRFAADRRPDMMPGRLLHLSAFTSILEGDKCFLGSVTDQESPMRYMPESQKLFASLAVFPLSKTESPQLNIRKRIIVGFLVIDSPDAQAFQVNSSESLGSNIYYRAGSAFADSLALLIPLLTGTDIDKGDANNPMQATPNGAPDG